MADYDDPTTVELHRLVQGGQMTDAIKHLWNNGMGLQEAKERVTEMQRVLDPDAARTREDWLDVLENELGASEK